MEAWSPVGLGKEKSHRIRAFNRTMAGLRRFYPESFDIIAITVDLGYGDFNLSEIEKLCRNLKVEYHIVKTRINEMVEDGQCSLCARLRKGALNEKAKEGR